MGELNNKPFYEVMKKKYRDEAEAEERASELGSLWEEYLKDPEWHPTRVIMINGKEQVSMCILFLLSLLIIYWILCMLLLFVCNQNLNNILNMNFLFLIFSHG